MRAAMPAATPRSPSHQWCRRGSGRSWADLRKLELAPTFDPWAPARYQAIAAYVALVPKRCHRRALSAHLAPRAGAARPRRRTDLGA